MRPRTFIVSLVAPLVIVASSLVGLASEPVKLINVSYDPTRELYEELNRAFIDHYQSAQNVRVSIEQSHGGSSKQARAVLDGVRADVVTLALGYDVLALQKGGLIYPGWEKRLPDNSSPYTSTIVFVVRKGNPRRVKDWNDLLRQDVQTIVANPKTSGGARWAFLAAWGFGAGAKPPLDKLGTGQAAEPDKKLEIDESKGNEFVRNLYQHVPVLDTGARGSTITFAQKNVGDVLLNWENEAWLAIEEFGADKLEIVYPSVSILAEPPVAVVDKVVDEKRTRAVAEAYLKFLYTPEAQEIIAANHYRPRLTEVLNKHAGELPPIQLFTLAQLAGDWTATQQKFFADGGVFDQIYGKK